MNHNLFTLTLLAVYTVYNTVSRKCTSVYHWFIFKWVMGVCIVNQKPFVLSYYFFSTKTVDNV